MICMTLLSGEIRSKQHQIVEIFIYAWLHGSISAVRFHHQVVLASSSGWHAILLLLHVAWLVHGTCMLVRVSHVQYSF